MDSFAIFLRDSRNPLRHGDRIYTIPLGGGTTHRIPGVIPAITFARQQIFLFFARSTRLLVREIARIANRQYLNSRREKEQPDHHLLLGLPLSLFLFCCHLFVNIIFTITHTLRLFLPPSLSFHLPPTISRFLARLRCEGGVTSNPVFSNTRATRKPVSSRSRHTLSNDFSILRCSESLSVIRDMPENAVDVCPSIII